MRRALQRLPLGPDESHSIAALEEQAAGLRARAEELRAQTVPRPQPSQYPALQQELARFMHNLGSVQRIAALLHALQVRLLCVIRLIILFKDTLLCARFARRSNLPPHTHYKHVTCTHAPLT